MLIAAFALGVWFAWLLDTVASRTPDRWNRLGQSNSALVLITTCFVVVAAIYYFALAAEYWRSGIMWPRRVVSFVLAPVHLRAMIWFALGVILFRYRGLIGAFSRALLVSPPKKGTRETDAGAPPEPRAWLTTAGGLPILATIFAITILIYFGEDLRVRLKSIKFGLAEADFATATQETLRVGVRQESTSAALYRSYASIVRGFENREVFETILTPTHDRLTQSSGSAGNTARMQWTNVAQFHQTFTFPLSDTMACFSAHFPVGDTEVHHKVVMAATEWRMVSTRAALLIADKQPHDADKLQKIRTGYCSAGCKTLDLIHLAAKAVEQIGADSEPCKKVLANKPNVSRCEAITTDREPPQAPPCPAATANLESVLPDLLSSGSVTSFISGLITTADTHRPAAEYLTEVGKSFDEDWGPSDPIGRMYYYFRRGQAKFEGRWYPRDATSDLRRARSFVEQILLTAKLSSPLAPPNLAEHFETVRAGIINNEIYYTVFQWLEGQQLSAHDMSVLELLGQALEEWLDSRQVKALAITSERQTILKNRVFAAAKDTLAMRDIAIGATRRDFGQERCDRIRRLLAEAQEMYDQLYKQIPGQVRDNMRVVEAHRSLFESVCSN
jgi:hypothetical protein